MEDIEYNELWERFSKAIDKKMERAYFDFNKRWKEFSQKIDEQLGQASQELESLRKR